MFCSFMPCSLPTLLSFSQYSLDDGMVNCETSGKREKSLYYLLISNEVCVFVWVSLSSWVCLELREQQTNDSQVWLRSVNAVQTNFIDHYSDDTNPVYVHRGVSGKFVETIKFSTEKVLQNKFYVSTNSENGKTAAGWWNYSRKHTWNSSLALFMPISFPHEPERLGPSQNELYFFLSEESTR